MTDTDSSYREAQDGTAVWPGLEGQAVEVGASLRTEPTACVLNGKWRDLPGN